MAKTKSADPNQTVSVLEYTVLSPLLHDGERYAEGDKVELTEKQAAALISNGTVKAA